MEHFTHCVKCGAAKTNSTECPSCGVIYEKAERVFLGRLKNENEDKKDTVTHNIGAGKELETISFYYLDQSLSHDETIENPVRFIHDDKWYIAGICPDSSEEKIFFAPNLQGSIYNNASQEVVDFFDIPETLDRESFAVKIASNYKNGIYINEEDNKSKTTSTNKNENYNEITTPNNHIYITNQKNNSKLLFIFSILFSTAVISAVFYTEINKKDNIFKKLNLFVENKPSILPFKSNTTKLEYNYKGLDPVKFYTLLESKIQNIEKGKFETSKEFDSRTNDLKYNIKPFNIFDKYDFLIKDIDIDYNADNGYFFPRKIFSNIYQKRKKTDNYRIIRVSSMYKDESLYTGSNAFGLKRDIKKTRYVDFGLAIDKNNSLYRKVFTEFSDGIDIFSYDLKININKAKQINDKKICILFIGRLVDSKILSIISESSEPTIHSPIDNVSTIHSIPFDLYKIIYYVFETGEIIGEIQ